MPSNALITYSCKLKNHIALSGIGLRPASTVPSRRMSPCLWVNHPYWDQKSFGSLELQTDAGSSSGYPSSGDAGRTIGYSNMAYEITTHAHFAAKRPRPVTTWYASVFSAKKSGLSPCDGLGGNIWHRCRSTHSPPSGFAHVYRCLSFVDLHLTPM
jgi:hypothetical protein